MSCVCVNSLRPADKVTQTGAGDEVHGERRDQGRDLCTRACSLDSRFLNVARKTRVLFLLMANNETGAQLWRE